MDFNKKCDFYIVIISGRYGSVHPKTKISYTQMEYEYAYEIGIPILAFLHKDPKTLPSKKIEKVKKSRKKLKKFKKRILNERYVKYWCNPYDLASSVKTSISQEIKSNPPIGWIKYKDALDINKDYFNNQEMYKKINELINITNIIISNYKDIFENEKKENSINSSELLNQINELKDILKSNNTKNSTSTDTTKKTPTNAFDYTHECIYKICSKNIAFSLNSMHVSALKEITNMMFSSAITALSEFFYMSIKADYSYLQICKNYIDVKKFINSCNKYGLLSEFHANSRDNNMNGKIYLNLSLKVIEEISSFLTPDCSHCDTNHGNNYFKSALQELSNIFVGASLTALSTILNTRTQMSATIINTDITKIDLFKNDNTILISKFSNDKNEVNLFDAYLILEPAAIKSLLELAFGEPIM